MNTTGYPGFDLWVEKLMLRYGVSEVKIIKAPPHAGGALNTNTELLEFILFAKTGGWKSVAIVASPFHQLHSLVNAITVAIREYPEFRLYSLAGTVLPWGERVRHSQRMLVDTRAGLIHKEMDRIRRYTEQGDLPPAEAILAYMDERDVQNQ